MPEVKKFTFTDPKGINESYWYTPIEEDSYKNDIIIKFDYEKVNNIYMWKATTVSVGGWYPSIDTSKYYSNIANLLRSYGWLDDCKKLKIVPVQRIDLQLKAVDVTPQQMRAKKAFEPVDIIKD